MGIGFFILWEFQYFFLSVNFIPLFGYGLIIILGIDASFKG